MKKNLLNLLMAVTVIDFSIVDLPYKYGKLQVVAHMSNGTDCPVTLNKDEFYDKFAKETKELFALIKDACEPDSLRTRDSN
jgi:hypothetical protein